MCSAARPLRRTSIAATLLCSPAPLGRPPRTGVWAAGAARRRSLARRCAAPLARAGRAGARPDTGARLGRQPVPARGRSEGRRVLSQVHFKIEFYI